MNATTRAVSISAVSALVLAAVVFLWPSALGGGTVYVTTHGISMEPGFHTGDLAILRSAPHYRAGDVVAYRAESLNTIVMHRIVAVEGDRFVIQGDNNAWLDQDQPTEEQVLGSLFFRIPQGGKALAVLKSPAVLALAAVAALLALAVARKPRRPRHARPRHRRAAALRPSLASIPTFSMPTLSVPAFSIPALRIPAFSMPTRARARQVALAAGAVALLAAAGGGALLVLPSTQTETRELRVNQQGEFSYTGQAAPGTTYPSGVIATGDTVWTRLAENLTVSLATTVSGPDLADVTGALRLDVVVSAADGWSAVLNSGTVTALQNGTATASVAVDAGRAATLLSRHYAEIGATGGSATLTVTPVAETRGTAQGQPFTAGSPAGLAFTLDAVSLRPAGNADAGLTSSTDTTVQVDEIVPRTLPVLGLSVPLDVARLLAAVVLAAAVVAAAVGGWIGRLDRRDAADEFLVRHAQRIVPVAAFTPGPTVIDVSDAESLRRVAERFDTVVLHHAGEDEDVFAVRDVDATYRFVMPGSGDRRRGMPPVPAPASEPAPAPVDMTAPLAKVVPAAVPVHGGLWGRLA